MTVLDSVLLEEYERKKKMKIAFKKELEDNPNNEHTKQMKEAIAEIEFDQLKILAALFVAGIDIDASDMVDVTARQGGTKMQYDINALPGYLRKDLLALQEAIVDPKQQIVLDCLQCELLGSINAARTGHEISDELADYLVYEYVYEREEQK